jgi:hypothetical protein
LDPTKGEQYLAAIVALGHLACHIPDKFPVQIKQLVTKNIVRDLLFPDRTEVKFSSPFTLIITIVAFLISELIIFMHLKNTGHGFRSRLY